MSESFTLRILRDVLVIRFGIDTSLEVAKVESGVKQRSSDSATATEM